MSSPSRQPQEEVEESDNLVEFYADSMRILTHLYSATLLLGESRPEKPELLRARIKVSPHMLKAMSLLLAKHVRELENATGQKIGLPNQLLHDWGLEEEIK